MKKILISAALAILGLGVQAQQPQVTDCSDFKSDTSLPGLQWFPDAKFGVFIHMTLDNVPMTEQERHDYKNDPEVAHRIAARLDLSKYNAREQARLFKSWGANYVILTTKHHVGFCLFDGPSDFDVIDSSTVGRDIVREYIAALRDEGIKVGLYYSLPDWTNRDYASLVNERVPAAERKATRAYALENDTLRWNRFVDQMFREVEHLCTDYGKIDLLWFDGDWERSAEQWRSKELACMIYRLQPECVVNNRLRHIDLGHYITAEQTPQVGGRPGWWEYCMTTGDNWDGVEANANIKPAREIIGLITDVFGLDGNALVNVAPTDCGAIPQCQLDTMNEVGRWITDHSEAIFGTVGNFPIGLFHGPVTRRDKTLYLFAQDAPRNEIALKGTNNNIRRITDLRTGTDLPWRYSGGYKGWNEKGFLYITIPEECIEPYTTVIKVEFEDEDITFRTPDGKKYNF